MPPLCRLQITPPQPFDLDLVVRSHGWYTLPPFRYDADRARIAFVAHAPWGPCTVEVRQAASSILKVTADPFPEGGDRGWVRHTVVRVLSLDQDLSKFLALCRSDASLRWAARRGAGRLLRSPSAWEDLIKVLCTTNCSWSLTRQMVFRFVDRAGPRTPGGVPAFPRPRDLAGRSEQWFRDEIRAGYRSRYFARLCTRVEMGELDPELWAAPQADSGTVERELHSIDGAGPYAVEQMHRLLGRFDGLALDSLCRTRYADRYHGGRRVKDTTIRRRYAKFGEYAGLALWLDLTADWHLEIDTAT